MTRKCIGLVLLLVVPLRATARPMMDWTVFRHEDGLAHNVVTSVVGTRDGALWFATRGGISRYDGRAWRTYGESDGLPGSGFSGLFEAENGALWATGGGVGFRRQAEYHVARLVGDRWEPVILPGNLAGVGVGSIVAVAGGGLCFATAGMGILHYDGDAWKTIEEDDGLASNHVQCLLRSKDGAVWAAYAGRRVASFSRRPRRGPGGGVGRFDPAKNEWVPVAIPVEPPGGAVTSMAQAADGAIWMGTENSGILRYDGVNWQAFTTADGLPANRVLSIATAPDGSVWAGTVGGAARFRSSTGESSDGAVRPDIQVFTEENGLPNNLVRSIWVDGHGVVWVGTAWGVGRYGATGWVYQERWAGAADRGGVALERSGDGRLWSATGEWVYAYDRGHWVQAYRLKSDIRRRPQRIVDLKTGKDGMLWVATDRRLVRFDGENWKELTLPVFRRGSRILSIFPARTGGVWAGTRSGLYRFDGAGRLGDPSIVARGVHAIYEAADGALWLGANGVVILKTDNEDRVFTSDDGLPSEPVVALAEAYGSMWAATRFRGIFRYNQKTWEAVPKGNPTIFAGAHRFFVDEDGALWLASLGAGAVHTNGDTWTRYTVRTGLPGGRIWDITQDNAARVWFATEKGLGVYSRDKDAPETTLSMPPGEVAPHQSVLFKFSGQDAWKQTPTHELKYAWRVNEEVSAPFVHVMTPGIWTPFSGEDQALLSRLDPGRHTFEVRAMDEGFNVDPTPARHQFVVLAPVWRRPWFVALSVFSVVAICVSSGYALHRHRRWRESQALQILELESELQKAHRMQMGLLPATPIRGDSFEIAGVCAPANHVGGDYFNYFWLDDARRTLGFGAADVSGKAMEAAVHAMQLSGIFRYEFRGGRPLNEVAMRLDEDLREQMDEASFVTCCLGTLDLETRHVHLINAAHPFPYHFSASADELRAIHLPSIPLGMVLPPGSPVGHAKAVIQVAPQDLLVFYSDGVTDMRNEYGEFYETDRLEQKIKAHIRASAEDLVSLILEDVYLFKGDASQPDDMTLLVIRMLEQGSPGR